MSKRTLYPNWPAIFAIKDMWLRRAMLLLEMIEGGTEEQAAFPQYFTTEKITPRVPYSIIREWLAITVGTPGDSIEDEWTFDWGDAVDDFFMVPILKFFGEGDGVPDELIQQLVGKTYRCGIELTYNGVPCIIASVSKTKDGISPGQIIRTADDARKLCFTIDALEYFDPEN
jgi:hypothetical protein